MEQIAKLLIGAGIILIVVGVLWGIFPFGRLPGDIAIGGKTFRFYFPLATSLLLSIIAALLYWIYIIFVK